MFKNIPCAIVFALAALLFNSRSSMLYACCIQYKYLHSGVKNVVISLKYVDHFLIDTDILKLSVK